MDDAPEVVFAYSDAQALADGVLIAIPGPGPVNRVTQAVFAHFTERIDASKLTGPVVDLTPVRAIIRQMLEIPSDADGWRTSTVQGRTLWLVPNEVKGLTLMFPSDY